MRPYSPIILALDLPTAGTAIPWVKQFCGKIDIFKVGMQLFYKEGPEIIRQIQAEGGSVFLDLKLHDIPNTVAKACESIAVLNPSFLTIHVSGGSAMLKAAQGMIQETSTKLLGITALTSLDTLALQEVYPELSNTPSPWGLHLATIAQQNGLFGIVCSAQENPAMRKQLDNQFCLVNPGIRPKGSPTQDQKRVMTPAEAITAGANYLVMGRPILESADPQGMVEKLLEEVRHAAGLPS